MLEGEVDAGQSGFQKAGSAIHEGETLLARIDRELDLKGKVCPYTFVESMLALEEMEVGEVLRVIVDYAPSACEVPKSLKREGFDILEVSKMNETDWAIVVRNREFVEG